MSAATEAPREIWPLIPSPYPQRTTKLPHTRDGIDAAWLTSMLANRHPGIVVEGMEVVQLFDSHTTKMRIRVRLNEIGRAAGIPENLCLKSNWSGMFGEVDICAIEALFYETLAPHLQVPTATCFYADWDNDGSGQGLVVLEDLIDRGGFFGHSTQHAGIESVATALKGLAKLHGSLWNSDRISEASAPWLQTSMRTPVDHDQIKIMWHWVGENLKDPKFRAIAPRHYLDDPQRVVRAYAALVEYERAFQAPYCVILGDCHQGNTYVLPNGERLWLDWQLVRRGRPWRDVSYFMIGSLTTEERRAHERDLLALYRDALVATGADDVIGLDEVWEQYRRWPMYGVQAWIANMDHWGQNGLPMNERFFAAAADLGTWDLLLD